MKHIFICASPRTGSNHLINLLEEGREESGLASHYELLFNPGINCSHCKKYQPRLGDKLPLFVASRDFQEPIHQFDYEFYKQLIRELYQTYSNNKPITIKWFSYSLEYLLGLMAEKGHPPTLETLQEVFGEIQWIYLKRNNKIHQAVSAFLAYETNKWVDLNIPGYRASFIKENPPYDFHKIFEHFRACVESEAKWNQLFESHSISPDYVVSYEAFQDYPDRILQEISEAFTLDLKVIPPERNKFNRQFSQVNLDYARQFENDLIQLIPAPEGVE
jgi:LPS sulfotransferase NodH